jgi:hypothetical protein
MSENYFVELNKINVNDKVEKKNNLTYLSWAWAWGEVKKKHPDATYTIYENNEGWNYFTDGRTAWVKTGVTINSIEHIEYLPVMDFRNKSIPLDNISSFDVNKTIQRSLTKAVARHGLGLYIYAGEDLPEDDKPQKKETLDFEREATAQKTATTKALNKAIKEGTPLVKPQAKGTLDERYTKAVNWVNSIDDNVWSPTPAQRDSLNLLLDDLQSSGELDKFNSLKNLLNQKDKLDDEIPY